MRLLRKQPWGLLLQLLQGAQRGGEDDRRAAPLVAEDAALAVQCAWLAGFLLRGRNRLLSAREGGRGEEVAEGCGTMTTRLDFGLGSRLDYANLIPQPLDLSA